jgi:glycine/D-amino acid oxidase-like deaminating enzyme
MALPAHVKYLIIGAGVHGLSTGYHLALELKARGKGSGKDILIVDKAGIAGGASGIACGVIRNNYFQPAMQDLMVHSVEIWESDPKAFAYLPVGYMQISPEPMHENVATIARHQKEIGYESVFVEGAGDCDRYMKGLLHDWQAPGITSVLHEKRGGYAHNAASMYGLATKAENEGVRISTGISVRGFSSSGGALTGVETDRGPIRADYVIVGCGPWVRYIWDMLELPKKISIKGRDGVIRDGVPMWRYWFLQEGTLGLDPGLQKTNDGKIPPVIHVDSDAPLHSDEDGSLITDGMWGIYYKPDTQFGGIQGGAAPIELKADADAVAVDPYGPESPEFVVGPEFAHMWCSALAHCQKRFAGKSKFYKDLPSGGLGAFTPDNFPVFDLFRENCYVIADSNHGYKMIGVGKLVAREVCGERSELLQPFRFSRYAEGRLHPESRSPFPWS